MSYIDLSNRKNIKTKDVAPNEFNPRNDLRGKRFGRLQVLDFSHKGGKDGRKYFYKCLCDCGKECVKSASYLLNSETFPHPSCGCWRKELNIASSTTHGRGKKTDREYKTWCEIKGRCYNENSTFYKNYGGRGIKMCDRWLNSFENFIADMGNRPSPKHSIDRIDVNGDYTPENCRWATMKEQCNNRRSNIRIEYQGKTQTLKQWCEELGLNYPNAYSMLRNGRSFEFIVNHQLKK